MSVSVIRTVSLLAAAAGLLGLALAACSQTLPPGSAAAGPAQGRPTQDRCNAEPARVLVGRKATAAVLEEARQLAGADAVRKLTPDMMVTKEYRHGRLNVHVGTDDRVSAVHCG